MLESKPQLDAALNAKQNKVTSELDLLIRPMPRARYEVDSFFGFVEEMLSNFAKDVGLNLIPDFQRGHVWTQDQQERWIEAVLRGAISSAGLLIQFNAPSWSGQTNGQMPKEMVCIDGLQRLTAVRRFVAGEIMAFGRTVDQFDGTSYDVRRYHLRIAVHEFQTRADLLTYYLDLNAGGTPHSTAEIERVQALRDQAIAGARNTSPASRP